jgi:hypothetical protein
VNKRKGINHPDVRTKRAVILRDGGWCLLALPGCSGEAQTTDHRANRGAGGSRVLNDPVNLVAACTACNGAKADGHAIILANLEDRGLYIRPHSTHAKTLERARTTPVEYLDGQRFYLIDASTRIPVTGRTTP